MWNDVVDLRDFYDTRLGQVARHLIRRRIRAMWLDMRGQTLLGLGYATPYLRQFRDEAARVISVMPAAQGVLPWPAGEPNLVTLADETELPLPDMSVDRVLLVHGVECGEHTRDMLREVWRVLGGSGRLLIVVPNRRGIWARMDRTPFGQGHPYSPPQLSRLLRDNLFTPVQSAQALFVPPTRSMALLSTAPAWERIGGRWLQRFGGVIVMEAAKQIYAGTTVRARHQRRSVIVPFPQPAGQSASAQPRSVPPQQE